MALQWQLRDQTIEVDPVDQCRDTDRVVALSGQQGEVDKIAKGIRQRHDLGRDTTPGGAYGLALIPGFTDVNPSYRPATPPPRPATNGNHMRHCIIGGWAGRRGGWAV